MSDRRVFTLPDVGEGLTEARIERFLVAPGEQVANLQPLLEVETDKSVVELTSPWAGTVAELLVAEGDWVDVGGDLVSIDVEVA